MKKNSERDYCIPLFRKTKRIMKITTLFSLGVACCISASTYAQSYKVSINKQNSSIIEILREIEKSSEFTFFFNDNRVNVNKTASVNAKNATLEDVLDQVLRNTGYKYQIIDRQVLIKASDNLLLTGVQQNQKAVTGVILDESGLPVIGANVVEKGTTNGTITDAGGRFSLNVASDATLIVSYIGYIQRFDRSDIQCQRGFFDGTFHSNVVYGYAGADFGCGGHTFFRRSGEFGNNTCSWCDDTFQ